MRFQSLKPPDDGASAEQVRALRERRGWTVEHLADEVHASPLEVSAWEAGAVRVPSKQALLIRWHTERAAWGEALRTAQERTCPWARDNAPELYERMFRKPAGRWHAGQEPVRAHVAGCARCTEVWDAAKRTGGFPAKPDTSGSLSARYVEWVSRLPRWAATPIVWARIVAPFVGGAIFVLLNRGKIFGTRGGGLLLGLFLGLGFEMLVTLTLPRRRTTELLAGLALGAGGLLGWALLDPLIDLGNPRHWAAAMAVGCGIKLVQWVADRLLPRRKAKALTAGTAPQPALSPPPPDPAASLERGAASSRQPARR